MTRLLLIRHGITDWNAHSRFLGYTDIPLSDLGSRQALALAEKLAYERIDTIYTSDLRRAVETTRTVVVQQQAVYGHQPQVFSMPELRELNFGEWEGLTYAEIQQRDPQMLERWQESVLDVAPPGGETLQQVVDRVQTVANQLRNGTDDSTVALVAHGGPLQVLICLAFGISPKMYWQFHLSPGSVSDLRLYPQGAILNGLNDTCHLEHLNRI